jgi:hypothetical protein
MEHTGGGYYLSLNRFISNLLFYKDLNSILGSHATFCKKTLTKS